MMLLMTSDGASHKPKQSRRKSMGNEVLLKKLKKMTEEQIKEYERLKKVLEGLKKPE